MDYARSIWANMHRRASLVCEPFMNSCVSWRFFYLVRLVLVTFSFMRPLGSARRRIAKGRPALVLLCHKLAR